MDGSTTYTGRLTAEQWYRVMDGIEMQIDAIKQFRSRNASVPRTVEIIMETELARLEVIQDYLITLVSYREVQPDVRTVTIDQIEEARRSHPDRPSHEYKGPRPSSMDDIGGL